MEQTINTERFTSRKWSLTKPTKASQLLHKLTGGKVGKRIELELDQKEMALYSVGAPEGDLRTANIISGYVNTAKLKVPTHVNCRCSVTPVEV